MSEYSRDLEQKQNRDYGTAGVLATSQSKKTKVKENCLTPEEWEEWKLADKQSKLTIDKQIKKRKGLNKGKKCKGVENHKS